ncbi:MULTISPECIES: ATP-binding protein [Streptomyces]|jgi:anti-sigma regulatory factor (Ser/Thr protein kinase)|uniref:Histidine kinase/HSP90-like ATPase domain-containing protein n=2 Tax=Streptomyces TaxID=1883 RepID=A0ABN1SXJ7_9ACTN
MPRHTGSSLLEALQSAADTALPSFGMVIRSEPSSVETVRRVTRAWVRCHCRLRGDQVDAFLIVVSELCTNAVLHGQCDEFDVRGWMSTAGELRFEVHDRTPSAIPKPQHPDAEAENGRGLLLVDCLVAELGGRWGFTEDGTCAWCTLVLPVEGR